MEGITFHPRCAHCGERIGVYEPMWLQHPDGTLTSTALLNLDQELPAGREHARFLHLGCLAPDQLPHTQAG